MYYTVSAQLIPATAAELHRKLTDGAIEVQEPDGREIVADIGGHGIGPALLIAQLQAYVRGLCETNDNPSAILTNANRLFYSHELGSLATAFLGRIDVAERTLDYASAGQQGFVVSRRGEVRVLSATGLPLGVVATATVPRVSNIQFEPGDTFMLATDGIEETQRGDETFGKNRLLAVLRRCRGDPADAIVRSILEEATTFARAEPQLDDMTVVIVKAM